MSALEIVVALVIAVGLAGTVIPVIPGVLLIFASIGVWAWQVGGATAWAVFAVATLILALGQVVKYAVPGRRLKAGGVPNRTLLAGGVGAIAGFFVIPVVGVLVGFPIGVYVAERIRLGSKDAGPATVLALKAVGASILIELVAGVMAAAAWAIGVITT